MNTQHAAQDPFEEGPVVLAISSAVGPLPPAASPVTDGAEIARSSHCGPALRGSKAQRPLPTPACPPSFTR